MELDAPKRNPKTLRDEHGNYPVRFEIQAVLSVCNLLTVVIGVDESEENQETQEDVEEN